MQSFLILIPFIHFSLSFSFFFFFFLFSLFVLFFFFFFFFFLLIIPYYQRGMATNFVSVIFPQMRVTKKLIIPLRRASLPFVRSPSMDTQKIITM